MALFTVPPDRMPTPSPPRPRPSLGLCQNSAFSAEKMFEQSTFFYKDSKESWNQYVKPRAYYEASLHLFPSGLKKVRPSWGRGVGSDSDGAWWRQCRSQALVQRQITAGRISERHHHSNPLPLSSFAPHHPHRWFWWGPPSTCPTAPTSRSSTARPSSASSRCLKRRCPAGELPPELPATP